MSANQLRSDPLLSSPPPTAGSSPLRAPMPRLDTSPPSNLVAAASSMQQAAITPSEITAAAASPQKRIDAQNPSPASDAGQQPTTSYLRPAIKEASPLTATAASMQHQVSPSKAAAAPDGGHATARPSLLLHGRCDVDSLPLDLQIHASSGAMGYQQGQPGGISISLEKLCRGSCMYEMRQEYHRAEITQELPESLRDSVWYVKGPIDNADQMGSSLYLSGTVSSGYNARLLVLLPSHMRPPEWLRSDFLLLDEQVSPRSHSPVMR